MGFAGRSHLDGETDDARTAMTEFDSAQTVRRDHRFQNVPIGSEAISLTAGAGRTRLGI